MSILLKVHKKLWGTAGCRCAFENCRKVLFANYKEGTGFITLGEEAHIISGKRNGPRYQITYPLDKIDSYDNLILLCAEHHTIVDNDVDFYTTDKLKEIKNEHENWVGEALAPNYNSLHEEELLAEYIDEIEFLAGFNNWDIWTSCLRPHFPKIEKKQFENLINLHKYLSGRIFPNPNTKLVTAIQLFRLILEDFIYEFEIMSTGSEFTKGYYEIPQLYKLGAITVEQQEITEYTIEALIQELTKAGNYLCRIVREELFSNYRLKEGLLLMNDAPIMGRAFLTLEYAQNETYVGVLNIKEIIKKRIKGL